jgi:hypothetical protein
MKLAVLAICSAGLMSSAPMSLLIGNLYAENPAYSSGWYTIGQTFVVPDHNTVMSSWTFSAFNYDLNALSEIVLSVHSMTGGVPGPALATSAPITMGNTPQDFTVGLNLPLTGGGTYLTKLEVISGRSGVGYYYETDTYAAGTSRFGNNFFNTIDLRFQSTFDVAPAAATPEPATAILAGTALALLAFRRRLSKRG